MVVLSMKGTYQLFSTFTSQGGWRSTTRYILERAQSGDGVLIYPFGAEPYQYYARRRQMDSMPTLVYPLELQGDNHDLQPAQTVEQVTTGYRRVWLLSTDSNAAAPVRRALQHVFYLADDRVFPTSQEGELRVALYVR
jgi:hypothetical protein